MKRTEHNKIEGKVLVGLELSNYIISEDGKVWGARKDRILKPLIKPQGYRAVFLTHDRGNTRWHYIHRLVAVAYIPNPDNLPIVRHLDNDTSNNHKDNLAWSTHKENTLQSIREGRFNKRSGKDNPRFGTAHSEQARQKMSKAKMGVLHPKFKGYYVHKGKKYASMQELADKLGTYTVKVSRMVKSGEIKFSPVI